MTHKSHLSKRVTVGGVILGLILTVFVIASVLDYQGLPVTFASIKFLHKNILFYLIDLLPLILGLLAHYTGSFLESRINILSEQVRLQQLRSSKLQVFADEILSGNINSEYDMSLFSDKLGKTLIDIVENIKNDKNAEEQRKKEDFERNWIAEGMARFGDILRRNNDNIELFSLELISNICKYVGSAQGGFYILNDNDKDDIHFELTAHFAYNRQKYTKKRIEWNEGLIGRAAFEKRTLNLTDIPEDYLEITSGLGEANPHNILIVPLKYNDEVHGVIEIAGFEPYESHHIDFIEKIAESIGSTLGNVKINIRTASLLSASQDQSERLAQQEEDIRQNMEELMATQEEATKQSEQFISFTNSVNQTHMRAEYDTSGTLTYANTKFIKKLEYGNSIEVEGHNANMFIAENDREWFENMWNELITDDKPFESYMKHITKKGRDLWTLATYTPVKNAYGEIDKVLFLAINTPQQKELSLEFDGKMRALHLTAIQADFTASGKVVSFNDKFQKAFEYSPEDTGQKSIFDFFNEDDQRVIEDIWNIVVNGIPHEGQVKMVTRSGAEKWFQTALVAKNSIHGEIDKIVLVATDITHLKELEEQVGSYNRRLASMEDKVKNAETELNTKLIKAKKEIKLKYQEIEKAKMRYEQLLENTADPIVMFNQKGIVEFFNISAEKLWQADKKMVLGRNIKGLFSEDNIKNNKFIASIVDNDKSKILNIRTQIDITNKSGETKQVYCLLSETIMENEHTYTLSMQTT